MKIAGAGDLHLTMKTARNRTDDLWEVSKAKLKFILDYCTDNFVSHFFQAGDFFDHHNMPHYVLQETIGLIRSYHMLPPDFFYAVYGQHDMRYHSLDVSNTPLRVLEAAGCVKRLSPEPIKLRTSAGERLVFVYGSSWGEDDPVAERVDDERRIWVCHRMFVDEKLWEEQKGYIRASHFIKRMPFDLVIAGDNHQAFHINYRTRHICNSGSMIRLTTAQLDHEPCFFVYDTESGTVERVNIPIVPATDVFKIEEVEEKKATDENIASFVNALVSEETVSLNFTRNVHKALESIDDPLVKTIALEALNG